MEKHKPGGGRVGGTTSFAGGAKLGGTGGRGIFSGSMRWRFELDGTKSSGTGHAELIATIKTAADNVWN